MSGAYNMDDDAQQPTQNKGHWNKKKIYEWKL